MSHNFKVFDVNSEALCARIMNGQVVKMQQKYGLAAAQQFAMCHRRWLEEVAEYFTLLYRAQRIPSAILMQIR